MTAPLRCDDVAELLDDMRGARVVPAVVDVMTAPNGTRVRQLDWRVDRLILCDASCDHLRQQAEAHVSKCRQAILRGTRLSASADQIAGAREVSFMGSCARGLEAHPANNLGPRTLAE